MKIKVIINVDIDELNLSVRSWNCLRRAKIDTVQDIVDRYDDLNKVRNLGQKCYDEVTEKIKPYVEFVDRVYTTNYDRIRSMSVEEMADKIYLSKCNCCKLLDEANVPHPRYCVISCKKYIKQWLLQEASDK